MTTLRRNQLRTMTNHRPGCNCHLNPPATTTTPAPVAAPTPISPRLADDIARAERALALEAQAPPDGFALALAARAAAAGQAPPTPAAAVDPLDGYALAIAARRNAPAPALATSRANSTAKLRVLTDAGGVPDPYATALGRRLV